MYINILLNGYICLNINIEGILSQFPFSLMGYFLMGVMSYGVMFECGHTQWGIVCIPTHL